MLHPRDRCDVYEIIAHTGTQRGADFYDARGPGGEQVVLKIMSAPGADKQCLRFAQEGQVLAMIVHPAVVRVLGAGALGDCVWLALEPMPGGTLGERLRAGGPAPLDDVLGWMQQVCSALAEAHRLGILHRNVMSDSVFLGPGNAVKLGDFGIAKLESFGVVTTSDQQIGSARCSAPEQLLLKEVGPPADLYGVGLLLYEAVTGQHPIGNAPCNVMTAVSWHLLEKARPLRELAPWASSDLEALVHQMMEKDPSRRPSSALEVHDRLRAERARLRAPLLRAARNAAPVERPIAFTQTVRMPAVLDVTPPDPTAPSVAAPGADRAALLPAAGPVPVWAATPPVPAQQVAYRPVPRTRCAQAPATPPTLRPAPIADVRVTSEPVASEARPSRGSARWAAGAALGAGLLTLAAAVAATGWMLLGRLPGSTPGTGSAPPLLSPSAVSTSSAVPIASPPAPTASPPAPTASASAATPRVPGSGTSKRARPPAPPFPAR